MKKVMLRLNEEYKYKIIKKLVETNGNKNSVALKLNCTRRTINRLIIGYKIHGKEFFIHGNRNKKPSNYIPDEIKKNIINLYKTKYLNVSVKWSPP